MKNFFTSPLFNCGILLIAFLLLLPMIVSAGANPIALMAFGLIGMAVATAEVNTPERQGRVTAYPVAAATKIFAGTLVALDANGNAVAAADTAGLRVVGLAQETVDNSGGLAGAFKIATKQGVFQLNNSATDAVDANDKGKICFVEDDNTVCEAGANHKVKAGRVLDVTDAGVWVDTGFAAVVPSADTITGAADLAALKAATLAILQAQGLVK